MTLRPRTFRSRVSETTRAAASAAALVASGLLAPLAITACTEDEAPRSALDQVAPTRADIAGDASISFPPSTKDFRLVRISGSQIDVTFTIATADTDAFTTGSKLDVESGRRTIVHASPLWSVAVATEVLGASSTVDGVRRDAELVPDGDRTTVRLTVSPNAA